MEDNLNISPPLLNSKPNLPILGLCTAQVMGFLNIFSLEKFPPLTSTVFYLYSKGKVIDLALIK